MILAVREESLIFQRLNIRRRITKFIIVMVMYLYTAHIPIRFMAVNNSIIGGEIGRQLVKAPLAAAISPWLISPTQLTHTSEGRTDHNTGNSVPYSFRLVCGFFSVPQFMNKGSETGPPAYCPYPRRLESLTIC